MREEGAQEDSGDGAAAMIVAGAVIVVDELDVNSGLVDGDGGSDCEESVHGAVIWCAGSEEEEASRCTEVRVQ